MKYKIKKKKKNNLYIAIKKRGEKTYYSIEEKLEGKTIHHTMLPELQTLLNILVERKNNNSAEKITQETVNEVL
jgi:hypothetical protein